MAPPPTLQLLPAAFAGLPRQGDIVNEPSPESADSRAVAVLKEDGFVGASRATYAGNGAGGWTVLVLRFGDATGAYSAFTFYRNPGMHTEPVGDDAAADPGTFLVRTSASLVLVRPASTATSPQNASALADPVRGLVQLLPRRHGPDDIAPLIPRLLPSDGLDRQTLHYAIGPAAYAGPIPASSIDFSRDAETAAALYHRPGMPTAVLTLVMLPTPQIAVAQMHAISSLPDPSVHVGLRRLGPLLAVVSGGGVSPAQAATLLAAVHYRADLTLDQPQGYISEVAKAAKLLFGIASLTVILGIAAIVLGVFFGVGRVFLRRLQGKPDSSMYDEEFIRLKL